MNRALLYLAARQTIGGLKYRLSRLKNPRYLVPVLLAIVYFWLSFGLPGVMDRSDPRAAEAAPALRLLVGPGLALMFALNWFVAPARPAPPFHRAEAAQLFMLPLSRRQLIAYRLLRPQGGFLLIGALAAFGATRSADVNPVYAAAGAIIFINLISINAMAAALACNRMKRAGWPSALMIWPGLLLIAWVLAPLAINWRPLAIGDEPMLGWLIERLSGPTVKTLHWPLRQLGHIVGAGEVTVFGLGILAALVAGGMLFGLCMLLVAPYEEQALKIAEAGGRKLDAMRRGGPFLVRLKETRSTRLRLKPTGPAWRAVLWQTVVSEWRVGMWRMGFVFAALFAGAGVIGSGLYGEAIAALATGFSIAMGAMLIFMSPRMMATGLHTELRFLPVLKGLPIRGYDLLRGKVRGGVLLASAPAWMLLAGVAGAVLHVAESDELPVIAGVVVSAIPLIPAAMWVMISLESAAVLMFPAWMTSAQSEPGIESIGRNLMSLLVRVVVGSLLMVFPAGFFAAAVAIGFAVELPMLGFIAGSTLAAATAIAEAEGVMWLMGSRFDAMDASLEEA